MTSRTWISHIIWRPRKSIERSGRIFVFTFFALLRALVVFCQHLYPIFTQNKCWIQLLGWKICTHVHICTYSIAIYIYIRGFEQLQLNMVTLLDNSHIYMCSCLFAIHIYIHICIYIYIYIYTYIYIYIYTYTHTYIYIHICIHTYMNMCIHR